MTNKVTLEQIESSIKSEHYFTALEGVVGHAFVTNEDEFGHPEDLGLLTFCVLLMWNGFTVVGKSACADPKNYDEALGRKIARQDAINQVWPLLGYELKTHLYQNVPETSEPCTYAAYCELRGLMIDDPMTGEEPGYFVTYRDGHSNWMSAETDEAIRQESQS